MNESNGYDSKIGDKYSSPFAQTLRSLTKKPEDVKKLAEHLNCTPQAINQFRLGAAYPKTENLIKIADYYDISVDFLLGRSNVKSRKEDLQIAQLTTGLDEEAIKELYRIASFEALDFKRKPDDEKNPILQAVDMLLTSQYGRLLLRDIYKYAIATFGKFTCTVNGKEIVVDSVRPSIGGKALDEEFDIGSIGIAYMAHIQDDLYHLRDETIGNDK